MLTSTASDGFVRPASIRRTWAGSMPKCSAACSTVHSRLSLKARTRLPRASATGRNATAWRCRKVLGTPGGLLRTMLLAFALTSAEDEIFNDPALLPRLE